MDKTQVAKELVKLARSLTAGMSKNDVKTLQKILADRDTDVNIESDAIYVYNADVEDGSVQYIIKKQYMR